MPKSSYENFLIQLKEAAKVMNLDECTVDVISKPTRIIEISISVKMDNGKVRVFTGWRSQHNLAIGPAKGGIRYHPDVTRDEVIALSAWMSIKNSVVAIPYGGGKGGIRVNPKELSEA